MIIAAPGSRSEGLRIKVFPVATARGMVQSGIMLEEGLEENIKFGPTYAGKLNGATLAQTPSGTFLT